MQKKTSYFPNEGGELNVESSGKGGGAAKISDAEAWRETWTTMDTPARNQSRTMTHVGKEQ